MKKAIALIELIFAIVIIGITMLTIPNLLNTTTKAATNVITQEAVSSGASHIAMIMSQYWDEACANNDSPILYVLAGDIELNEANASKRRVGSNKNTTRRFKLDKSGNKIFAVNRSSFGRNLDINETEPDDVDDFDKSNYTLVNRENAKVETGEYKDKVINIATSVFYISDKTAYNNVSTVIFNNPFNTPNNISTNIKAIKVDITSANDKKFISLKAFSCNIGAQRLRRRDF